METDIDVLVIGGGAAGAAAALQLGRVRRSVAVVDAGEPRNAPSAHMHGYLGHDGLAPADFLKIAHTELDNYGVTISHGRITSLVDTGEDLVGAAANGDTYRARRVVLATGLTDVLPDIDGVNEHWGERIIHCPWCHGWEVRDQHIAVIDTSGMGVHQALVFAQLSDDITLIRNDLPALTVDETEHLRLMGIEVDTRGATAIVEHGDRLVIEMGSGSLDVDVAVVGPRFEPNVSMLDGLVEIGEHFSGMGRHVIVDEMGATSHPEIFAAGNVADPMQQVLHAAAHGSKIATILNAGLIHDDIERARRSETERLEWDERYEARDGHRWSGQPNGSLVVEAGKLPAGRALDVGCGEGADAIWLAQQGWEVTATDISTVAIDRARTAAQTGGVDVAFAAVDVFADPPPSRAFDLVVVSYPALKLPAGLGAFRSIAAAVASDGHLLVIGHVREEHPSTHSGEHGHPHSKAHGFDPNDYLAIADVLEIVGDEFVVEIDDERERPNAPRDARHQVDRVVLARRTTASPPQ